MKPAGKEEDVVYIGIDDPTNLRRSILETSKALVQVLKGQNSLREARTAKHKLIEELRHKVTEIGELIIGAKQIMPQMEKINLPKEKKETIKAVKAAPAARAVKIKQPAPAPKAKVEAHIDKFERELQDIENKLKSL